MAEECHRALGCRKIRYFSWNPRGIIVVAAGMIPYAINELPVNVDDASDSILREVIT
jgi:hypothetical protein